MTKRNFLLQKLSLLSVHKYANYEIISGFLCFPRDLFEVKTFQNIQTSSPKKDPKQFFSNMNPTKTYESPLWYTQFFTPDRWKTLSPSCVCFVWTKTSWRIHFESLISKGENLKIIAKMRERKFILFTYYLTIKQNARLQPRYFLTPNCRIKVLLGKVAFSTSSLSFSPI